MKLNSVIATLSALVVLAMMSSCEKDGMRGRWDDIDLIAVRTSKDGNWSMMNKKGKIVYDAEFKNQPSLSYNGLFSVEEGEGITVYSSAADKPKAVKGLENLKYAGCLEDGLMPVTFPNSRISIVDKEGKKQFELNPINNQEVVSCSPIFSDGLLLFKLEDGKCGYMDRRGKVVIPAKYDESRDFNEGLALVATLGKDSTSYETSVIDKSGKKQFTLKDDYEPVSYSFNYGKIIVRNDDVLYFFDTKGEKTKLPSKIKGISDYSSDYIIFRNDDHLYGVADIKGEVIVRAKYKSISFAGTLDTFLAVKDGDGEDAVLLDKKGEVVKELDYEEIFAIPTFGYLAKEGSTSTLLGDDFETKSKEEIYDYALNPSASYVIRTDYFDVNGVAKKIVSMIGTDGIGSYKFDMTSAQIMKNESPNSYTYQTTYPLPDLSKAGFRYDVSVKANFTASMADYSYSYDYYSYTSSSNYYWNPASRIDAFQVTLTAESEWGKRGFEALKTALSDAGFKLKKSGVVDNNSYGAFCEKGNVMVAFVSPHKGTTCEIMVYSKALLPEFENALLEFINANGKIDEATQVAAAPSDFEVPEEAVIAEEVVDSVAVEPVVAEPDYLY